MVEEGVVLVGVVVLLLFVVEDAVVVPHPVKVKAPAASKANHLDRFK